MCFKRNKSTRRFNKLCDNLTRNDPNTTDIIICYECPVETNRNARRLGVAMMGNTHVTSIEFHLNWLPEQGDYQSLLDAIEPCRQLERVALSGYGAADQRHRFIAAISRSSAAEVNLSSMHIGMDSLALLSRERHMVKLCFEWCHLVPRNGVEEHEVATALGKNRALRSMTIDQGNGLLAPTLLAGLVSHPTLEELDYCLRIPTIDTVARVEHAALCRVLESPGTVLHHLELSWFEFDTDRPFTGLSAAFQANTSLTKLTLDECEFDHASTVALLDMLRSTTTVPALTIRNVFFYVGDDRGYRAFFKELLRGNTGLKELNVAEAVHWRAPEQACQLLDAMAGNTTIERLILGRLFYPDDLPGFCQVRPTLRSLKELTIRLPRRRDNDFDQAAVLLALEQMLLALEQNSSLIKVTIVDEDGLLTEEDMARIASFVARNKDTLWRSTLYDSLRERAALLEDIRFRL